LQHKDSLTYLFRSAWIPACAGTTVFKSTGMFGTVVRHLLAPLARDAVLIRANLIHIKDF
jgi:hypothetical protein